MYRDTCNSSSRIVALPSSDSSQLQGAESKVGGPRLFFGCRAFSANGRTHNFTYPALVDVRIPRGRKDIAVKRSLSMCLTYEKLCSTLRWYEDQYQNKPKQPAQQQFHSGQGQDGTGVVDYRLRSANRERASTVLTGHDGRLTRSSTT